MTKIQSRDISVVIQGAINRTYTEKCIVSIRKFLPDAEIILSTWENSDIFGFDCDKILLNKDPGFSCDDYDNKRPLNINRWIVSSSEGVKASTRKYVLKTRTDTELVSTGFLDYWDSYSKREENYIISKHKILIPSPYTLRFLGDGGKYPIIPTPFHISDWYCFGLREDILKLVSCPLIENINEFARYYENRRFLVPYNTWWWMNNWMRKFAPEQYIGLYFAKQKFPEIEIENVFSFDNFSTDFSDHILLNNFVVLDPCQYGIHLNKYRDFSEHIYILGATLWQGMYRNYIYQKAYDRLFKTTYSPKIDWQTLKHFLFHLKRKIKQNSCFSYPIKFYETTRESVRRFKTYAQENTKKFIKQKSILHVICFTVFRVVPGYKVYKKIKTHFNNDFPILICPFRGTGDSYVVGNYYKVKQSQNKYNFIVPRTTNKKVLELFGIKRVAVLNEKEIRDIQQFQKVMHKDNLHILHFAPMYMPSSTGYNLACFKGLNFADFYDYIVFGEQEKILYQQPNIKETKNFYKLYGAKKKRTVLLAPYSDSISGISEEEWKYLAHKLKRMGYTVLTNCGNEYEKPIEGTRGVYIPFGDLNKFVEWCGYIISIRSGICDIICHANCKKIILYPKYIKYKYGSYHDFFSLNIPERNIFADEYEFNEKNNKNLIIQILKNFNERIK